MSGGGWHQSASGGIFGVPMWGVTGWDAQGTALRPTATVGGVSTLL